jgi:hypothetical protein
MHGKDLRNAQPAILFATQSKVCRQNAKSILISEEIEIDDRGIDLKFYKSGPKFNTSPDTDGLNTDTHIPKASTNPTILIESRAGKGVSSASRSNPERSQAESLTSSPDPSKRPSVAPTPLQVDKGPKRQLNGISITVGAVSCTLGGFIDVGGTLFGLTAAHAFETTATDAGGAYQ